MWDIYPEGIYNLLKRIKEKYGNIPCYITENGYPLVEAGKPVIEDDDRIEYLSNHIKAAHRAMEEGVQLKGYFHWTLMDNFEWHLGNAMRFGLIRVDFPNQERRWKKSAHWYKKLVETGKLET
jgi:beta-glucosidase